MSNEFKFENIQDYLDWYCQSCIDKVELKYHKSFFRQILKKVIRGIFIGLKRDIIDNFWIVSKTPPANTMHNDIVNTTVD